MDIVVLKTCPMDADGYFNFGPANLWHRAVIERARLVIVEVCESVPYVLGDRERRARQRGRLRHRGRRPARSPSCRTRRRPKSTARSRA